MSSSRYGNRNAQDAENALHDFQRRSEGNQFCADCGHPRPEFINLTIGTFICEICAEIHRSTSNRRIKDIYSGDVMPDDLRRMDIVGNDVANRKFLATWNPQDVPEPDRLDKNSLREFLWLKYDGSFKKPVQTTPPQSTRPQAPSGASGRDYSRDNRDRHYDDDRSRDRSYRREQEIFRDTPQTSSQQQGRRQQSYWASRFTAPAPPPASRPPPPPPANSRRDEIYRRDAGPPYPDRYRTNAPSERFQPPQPAQVAPHSLGRGSRSRHHEAYEEDYASGNSHERDSRRYASRAKPSRNDSYNYSDGEREDPSYKRRNNSSSKPQSRRRSSATEEEWFDSEEEGGSDGRLDKKGLKKLKKKTKESKSRRRTPKDEVDEQYDDEDEFDNVERKSSSRRREKADKRSDRDVDSIQTTSADGLEESVDQNISSNRNPKSEFDLMSEWMGDSKETDTSQGVPPPPGAVPPGPNGAPVQPGLQQAYQTGQFPMMPPMNMYNSVMPGMPGMPGFMPMVAPGMPPGFVPGMGMGGMPPSAMHPGMVGVPGLMPGAPMMPGMQGMMNGMQNLGLNAPQPGPGGNPAVPNAMAMTSSNMAAMPPPPPPPPLGMPAGPAPGPPPDPPQN